MGTSAGGPPVLSRKIQIADCVKDDVNAWLLLKCNLLGDGDHVLTRLSRHVLILVFFASHVAFMLQSLAMRKESCVQQFASRYSITEARLTMGNVESALFHEQLLKCVAHAWLLQVLSNFRGGGGDRRLKQELAAAQTAATVAYGTATAGARTSTNV